MKKVCVVGSGLSGIRAAIASACAGASTVLCSEGPILSGSSFYPGTWGLGLAGPRDESDEESLFHKIMEVGCGMADPVLAETLVSGILPAIGSLEKDGFRFRMPDRTDDGTLIPCFDDSPRTWRGLLHEEMTRYFGGKLKDLAVELRPFTTLVDLETGGNPKRVVSAIFLVKGPGKAEFCRISAGAFVLASGGLGGIFERSIPKGCGSSAALGSALRAGAKLSNLEFIQFIPSITQPRRNAIFNEKAFPYLTFMDEDGKELYVPGLKERGSHGPFTTRLKSREVDWFLHRYETGVNGLGPRAFLDEKAFSPDAGQMIYDYMKWLQKSRSLDLRKPFRIAPFFHASNGGIVIDKDGSAGVSGLYACGEATTGMHGADRLGGLSTANCLVFGEIAGKSSADFASQAETPHASGNSPPRDFAPEISEDLAETDRKLRKLMSKAAGVIRTEKGLTQALDWVRDARKSLPKSPTSDRLLLAEKALKSMADRKTSLASHCIDP